MTDRVSLVFGSVIFICLGALAWLYYYPASPMYEGIGLTGPRPNSGRRCGVSYYYGALHTRFKTNSVSCRFEQSEPGRRYEETVGLNLLSRRVVDATRLWATLDSAQWQRDQDSIATTMAAMKGQEMQCAQNPNGAILGQQPTKFWRFPTFFVRLFASNWAAVQPPDRPMPADWPRWAIQVS